MTVELVEDSTIGGKCPTTSTTTTTMITTDYNETTIESIESTTMEPTSTIDSTIDFIESTTMESTSMETSTVESIESTTMEPTSTIDSTMTIFTESTSMASTSLADSSTVITSMICKKQETFPKASFVIYLILGESCNQISVYSECEVYSNQPNIIGIYNNTKVDINGYSVFEQADGNSDFNFTCSYDLTHSVSSFFAIIYFMIDDD